MFVFILLLLATTALAVALVVYLARQCSMPGRLPLLWMLTAVAVWSGGYALELMATGLASKVFWNQVQYFGIVAIVPSWFAFVLSYTGLRQRFSLSTILLLALVPLVTLALVWTTNSHGLVWSRVVDKMILHGRDYLAQFDAPVVFDVQSPLWVRDTIMCVSHDELVQMIRRTRVRRGLPDHPAIVPFSSLSPS